MKDSNNYDVIIIGGSYAGLSAAMALGRSMRNVLIIDSGLPCNRQTPNSHNFLTQDGKTPKEISTLSRAQVERYDTVKFYEGLAVGGTRTAEGFEITTNAGNTFAARKLIFATGIKDLMPHIPGFAECWGISIIHCPYCHGYEYRKQNTAIVANGERAFHIASLVSNLTDSITILSTGTADFTSDQMDKLKKNQINVRDTKIEEFEYSNGAIKSVVFNDNTRMSFDVAYAAIPFLQQSDIPVSIGCELTEEGHIKVDAFQKTTVPGVFACGDNSSIMRSVAKAVYSGNLAGALVNGELTNEQF